MSSWFNLLSIRHLIPMVMLMIFHLLVSSSVGWYMPQLMNKLFQSYADIEQFRTTLYFLGSAYLIEYVNRFGYQLTSAKLVQRLLKALRQITFNRWLQAKPRTLRPGQDDFPRGEVLSRIMNDTESIRELVSSGSFTIIIDLVFVISSLAGFVRIQTNLGLQLIFLELVVAILLVWVTKKMYLIFMEVRKLTGLLSREFSDVTQSLPDLYYTPHEHYILKRGDKVSEDFLKTQLRANVWDASYYSAAESLYPILLALIFLISDNKIWQNVALMAVVIDLLQRSMNPLKEVAAKISTIQRARTGFQRIDEFLKNFSSTESSLAHPIFSDQSVPRFSFKLDHFQFGDGFSLNNIKFDLKMGETLAVIGFSGSGKSTLLKILNGTILCESLQLKINDKVINHADANYYVSLVDQNSFLFSSSLAFNLSFNQETSPALEEFWTFCKEKILYLRSWEINLSDSINPETLSHGQKQLISGLRALYLKKPIILMDEISSALDSMLEKALRDVYDCLRAQSMIIVVSHRIETILEADQILLLDQGSMEAIGSKKELERDSRLFQQFLYDLRGN